MENSFIKRGKYDEKYYIGMLKSHDLDDEDKFKIICLIISNCNSLEELLINKSFYKEFLDVFEYNNQLDSLSLDICKKIINAFLKINKDTDVIVSIIKKFSTENQIKLLPLFECRSDIFYSLIDPYCGEVTNEIFNNYNIDLTNEKIDFELLISGMVGYYLMYLDEENKGYKNTHNVSIPPKLLTKELAQKIWNSYDLLTLRRIINQSSYVSNYSILNGYIKEKEDRFIISSIKESLLPLYKSIYEKYVLLSGGRDEKIGLGAGYNNNEFRAKLYEAMTSEELNIFFLLEMNNIETKEQLFNFLQMISSEEISNYIIDYHFDEVYYNVMLDLRELINFYDRGNINLDDEHVRLYRMILDIDKLSVEDKVKLHLELKKYNIMSMFYDDMLRARRIVNNSIKDKTLNRKNIKKYKDEELSNKYGVDIYVVDSNDFCALVKSEKKHNCSLPTIYSYSLVGNKLLGTFKDIYLANTFVYDTCGLNPDQIEHVHPEDSFSSNITYRSSEAVSKIVNSLLTSDEIINMEGTYSEVVLLEKGKKRLPKGVNIPSLKPIALYSLKLSEKVIETAKRNNVGILLVNDKENNYRCSIAIYESNPSNSYYTDNYLEEYKKERRKKLTI